MKKGKGKSKSKNKHPIVHAETPEGQRAGEAMIEVIENQLRDNDPPATRRALERLMNLGEPRENAMRYIATVLAYEIFDAVSGPGFDEERYVRNLDALPQLPDDDDDEEGP